MAAREKDKPPSVTERVRGFLEADLVIHEANSRDILSVRRAARWILEHQGWDATEEAVVSALRRTGTADDQHFFDALDTLAEGNVSLRGGRALAVVPRYPITHGKIGRLWSQADPGDILGIHYRGRSVHLLVDEAAIGMIKAGLPAGWIEELHPSVSEIGITTPDPGAAAPYCNSILLHLLGQKDINVLDILGGTPEIVLLVPEAQTKRTFEAIEDFSGLPSGDGK